MENNENIQHDDVDKDEDSERQPLLRKHVSERKRQFACVLILVTETFERIAFLSMTVTLGIFLNKAPLEWTSYNSILAVFILIGTAYSVCAVIGILAETFFGRFRTVCVFFLIYFVGYIMFPIFDSLMENTENMTLPYICGQNPDWTASNHSEMKLPNLANWKLGNGTPWIPLTVANYTKPLTNMNGSRELRTKLPWNENCVCPIYIFIVLVAVGAGGVKTCLAPLGAEHFKTEEHPTTTVVQSFFDWFWLCANIGSVVALGVIAYVQQTFEFKLGYIGSSLSLTVAFLSFLSGVSIYKKEQSPKTWKAIKNCFGVLKYGCFWKSKCCWKDPLSVRIAHATALQDVSDSSLLERPLEIPKKQLDYARIKCGGPFSDKVVNESESFMKMVLILLTFIPYWTIYHQMPTAFIFQGLHMDLHLDRKYPHRADEFLIPVAWLYLAEAFVIVFSIPLLKIWLYPRLADRGCAPHILRVRIASGFFLAVMAMAVAGVVETERLSRLWHNRSPWQVPRAHNQNVSDTEYQYAEMSIAMQIPQYMLIGLAETFASVAGLELVYSQSPSSLQGLILSIFWFFCGLGSFVGAIFEQAFMGTWFFPWDEGNINCRLLCPDNINKVCHYCHLDYYFYTLAGFGFFGLLVFWALSYKLGIAGDTTFKSLTSDCNSSQSSAGHRQRFLGDRPPRYDEVA